MHNTDNQQFISVVIPTYNRHDLLVLCLDQLRPGSQTLDSDYYEVIVTDDGDISATKEFIQNKFPWIKLIKGPQKGPAANRNNGSRYAKGDWLVFFDDDCLPRFDCLVQYCNVISTSQYDVLEGKIIPDRPQRRYDEHSPVNVFGGNLWSCNFAINKKCFDDLEGFDENFPYPAMEDIDFYIRAQKVSKVCFVDEAVVVHPWRVMMPFKNYRKWLISHQYFCDKHKINRNFHYRWSRLKILVADFFLGLSKLVAYKFKGALYFAEKITFNFLMVFK